MEYKAFRTLVNLKFKLVRSLHEGGPSGNGTLRVTLNYIDRTLATVDSETCTKYLRRYAIEEEKIG